MRCGGAAASGVGHVGAFYLPPWRIDITVRPDIIGPLPVARVELARRAAAALATSFAPAPAALGVILSDDRELAALNREHLGHEGPTDVLSFPMLPPAAFPEHEGQDPDLPREPVPLPIDRRFPVPPGRRRHLGDVVVSVERATAQASEGRGGQTGDVGWSAADEMCLLVVHGVLHVCGWDHARPQEEAAMRRLERDLLERK